MEFFRVQSDSLRPSTEHAIGKVRAGDDAVGWLLERVAAPFSGSDSNQSQPTGEASKYQDADLVIVPEQAEGFAMWGLPKHNTFVKITYGSSMFRTPIVTDTDEPKWKNVFQVPFQSEVDLLVQVYHREEKTEKTEDILLGSIVVHRSALKRTEFGEGQWYDLNVPEESSVATFVQWPRIKLKYSISAVLRKASAAKQSAPFNKLSEPAGIQTTIQPPTAAREQQKSVRRPAQPEPDPPRRPGGGAPPKPLPREPARSAFLAQIDVVKPMTTSPKSKESTSKECEGHAKAGNGLERDRSAFLAQLRSASSSLVLPGQVDKATPPDSITSPGAIIKSILLGPDSPASATVQGPDSVDSRQSAGEGVDGPASGPRSSSTMSSEKSSDTSREGTAWPQEHKPVHSDAFSPGHGQSWSTTHLDPTSPPGSPAQPGPERASSEKAGWDGADASRTPSFPRVLQIKPVSKHPGPSSADHSLPLPGHCRATLGEQPPGLDAEELPRTRSAQSPPPSAAVPKVLVSHAVPNRRHVVSQEQEARAEAAGGGQAGSNDDTRQSLVKLAELLARRGNMEGSAHALRRAAMLHWQSTGSDLDIVSC